MTLTRSALPQRSPMPLIVPCTCVAPLRHRRPGCWPPPRRSRCGSGCRAPRAAPAGPRPRAAAISSGSVPPLVSHRMTTRRPGVLGGAQRLQGVVGVVAEAVEEMLGVVEDLAARPPCSRPPSRRSCAGSLPGCVPSTSRTCMSQVLPTMVMIGACASSRALRQVSSAGPTPLRRVMPKAATLAWRSGSLRTSWKYSKSLGLDSG